MTHKRFKTTKIKQAVTKDGKLRRHKARKINNHQDQTELEIEPEGGRKYQSYINQTESMKSIQNVILFKIFAHS